MYMETISQKKIVMVILVWFKKLKLAYLNFDFGCKAKLFFYKLNCFFSK